MLSILSKHERRTGGDFVLLWSSVGGRTAFHDVADVNLIAGELDGFDDFGEQLSGGSHERQPLSILVCPRSFAHEDQLGLGSARAKHDVGSAGAKLAAPAISQIGANTLQAFSPEGCLIQRQFEQRGCLCCREQMRRKLALDGAVRSLSGRAAFTFSSREPVTDSPSIPISL